MRFPILSAIAEPAPKIECAPRDAGPAAARGGFEPAYSILIASGNAEERELLAALLSKAGYAVTAVENGELALKRFYAHKFDLVVANVVMPRIDGLELIQTLSSVTPAVAVIALAPGRAKIDRVYLDCATLLGAAGGFTQPLNKKAFLSKVRKVLPSRPMRLV